MSSTNRGAVRDLDDYYATPPALARLICAKIGEEYADLWGGHPINVLEPGCGAGSFLVGARALWPEAGILGVEVSPALAEKARSKGFHVKENDFLKMSQEGLPDYHLIVGNPPFKHAEPFIRRGLRMLDHEFGRLSFLLRLNFFGGQDRFEALWANHLPERIHIMPARPGFTADGKSDSVEYMVATFAAKPAKSTILNFLDNRAVENKWRPGAYEDPRRVWFPDEPQSQPTIEVTG